MISQGIVTNAAPAMLRSARCIFSRAFVDFAKGSAIRIIDAHRTNVCTVKECQYPWPPCPPLATNFEQLKSGLTDWKAFVWREVPLVEYAS